eukprot:231_1
MLSRAMILNRSIYSHSRRLSSSSAVENKVAVVTGAASGIGRATAKLLHQRGAHVCAVDINQQGLESLNEEIYCKTFPIDVTNETMVETCMKNVYDEFGRLNILCNIAGIAPKNMVPLHMKSVDEMKNILDNHLLSTLICNKYGIIYMLETLKSDHKLKSCSIVNTSSGAASRGVPGIIEYATAKHGIIGVTKAICSEYGASKIRCNAIQPGVIDTPMISDVEVTTPGYIKQLQEIIPTKQLGTADEVAELCVYLASDLSHYINGSVITIDEGITSNLSALP